MCGCWVLGFNKYRLLGWWVELTLGGGIQGLGRNGVVGCGDLGCGITGLRRFRVLGRVGDGFWDIRVTEFWGGGKFGILGVGM